MIKALKREQGEVGTFKIPHILKQMILLTQIKLMKKFIISQVG